MRASITVKALACLLAFAFLFSIAMTTAGEDVMRENVTIENFIIETITNITENITNTIENTTESSIETIIVDENLTVIEETVEESFIEEQKQEPIIEDLTEEEITINPTTSNNSPAEQPTALLEEAVEIIIPTSAQKPARFMAKIKDAKENNLEASILFMEIGTSEVIEQISSTKNKKKKQDETLINASTVDAEITITNSTIKSIKIRNLKLTEEMTEFIKIDDAPEMQNGKQFKEVYAIDPTQINFTSATVTVVAKGTELYKCKDWNFEEQQCYGEWALFKTGLVPGQEYSFELTPEDPGFAESQPGAEGKDTYLVSGSPSQNFGADVTMDVKGDDNRRALLEFNLSTIPSTAGIQTAVLQLYVTSKGTGTPTVNLYRINNTWTEGTGTGAITNNGATWNSRNGSVDWGSSGGDYHTTVHANTTLAATNTWYSWDITTLVQEWINGTYPNYGLMLRDMTTNTGTWTFASSDSTNASIRPKLNINYTESVAPSINLIQMQTITEEGANLPVSLNITDNDEVSTVWMQINSSTYYLVQNNTNASLTTTVNPKLKGTFETNSIDSYKNSYDGLNSTCAKIIYDSKKLMVKTSGNSYSGTINSVKVNVLHASVTGTSNGTLHWATSSSTQGTSHYFNSTITMQTNTFDITSERTWSMSDFDALEIHVNKTGETMQVYEIWLDVNYTQSVSGEIWRTTINTSSWKIGTQNYIIYANDSSGNLANQTGSITITHPPILLNATVESAEGIPQSVQVQIYDDNNSLEYSSESSEETVLASLEPGTKDMRIAGTNGPMVEMNLTDITLTTATTAEIGYDDTPESVSIPSEIGTSWAEVYALDLSDLNFTNGTVTLTATGNKVYKCPAWNFTTRTCNGNWTLLKDDLVPGQTYTIEVSANDPGFGEIIATNAAHLDENYTFISNIYSQVSALDGTWSEPIYAGEIVRVTFAENLTNGRVIDVYVRSNQTIAYFDIYEAGTQHKVGRSGTTEYPELQYMTVDNLTQPTDTFDFKVVKVYLDQEDNSTNINENVSSFLEFDFIHDDVINSTWADGLIVYGELNVQTPRYRLWNDTSLNFTAELSAPTVAGDISWVVTRGNHERDEVVMGTIDNTGNDVNIQIFNASTKTWGHLQEVSTAIPNAAYRAFDIAIEDISGDALIVYEKNTTANNQINYRIWNGTGYTDEQILNTGFTANSPSNWVMLYSRTGTDEIMLLTLNAVNDLYAVPWNGSVFDTAKGSVLNAGTASVTEQNFAFGWEEQSGEGLVAYGVGNNIVFRNYTNTAPYWSTEVSLAIGNPLAAIRMCPEPTSDYVGVIWQDNGDDVNTRMWDGTNILASPPAEDAATEPNGADNVNVDCAWLNSTTALFGFVDLNLLSMDYFNFTKPNSWTTADLATLTLTTPAFASDDIEGLRFTKHPTTREIMITSLDILEDLTTILWNGYGFSTITASPLEGSTEVANAAQEGGRFDWYRFDPVPYVTITQPLGQTYSSNAVINISANITDNINVSYAYANITLPNGTIRQAELINGTGGQIYNINFTETTKPGIYYVRIIANDTSVHQNYNTTELTNFTILDTTPPSVINLVPTAATTYAPGVQVNISANATDDVNVSVVRANLTWAGGNQLMILLVNGTGGQVYINNYTTRVPGLYNITILANDTSGNLNSTEKTNFTITDSKAPEVRIQTPTALSVYNQSNHVNLSVNITDDDGFGTALANITYPNQTTQVIALSNITDLYSYLITQTNRTGTYLIRINATDNTGNYNDTEKTNFTVQDITKPEVRDITPATGTVYTANVQVNITANVTDKYLHNISYVYANITKPDSTIVQVNLTNTTGGDIYNASFSDTSATGTYIVRIIANDTSNNVNSTETITFSIQDASKPTSILDQPADGYTTNSSTIIFICNATDETALSNITLYHNINGTFGANITNAVTGTSDTTSFTITNIPDGTNYLWNCLATDSSGNAMFSPVNRTFTVDTTPPAVKNLTPATGTTYNLNTAINISANITDITSSIHTATANITLPNSTTRLVTLLNGTGGDGYSATFTETNTTGSYTIRITANDTLGNTNSTETTIFIIADQTFPVITTTGCRPLNAEINQQVVCNATITDNIGVDYVYATITLPNGTTRINTTTNTTSKYTFGFTDTGINGTYTVTWSANDTNGNIQTATDTFNVTDQTKPAVTLNSPVNAYNTSSNTTQFKFTPTDNYATTLNCTLYLDGTANETNTAAPAGSETTLTANGITEGSHSWNVTCIDPAGNSQTSETRTFTTDLAIPIFNTIDTVPSDADTLDPNISVTVVANVTDNRTAVDTVVIEYRFDSEALANLTTTLNTTTGNYTGTFTPTQSGIYYFRVYANDTAGNLGLSSFVNKTIEFERTWTRTPDTFTAIYATLGQNVTLGNLTINNTGDYSITFNITSDSNKTVFNETAAFTLAGGTAKKIEVYDNATELGIKTVTLNISTDSVSNSTPASQLTTGIIIVAPGQPFLTVTFTTPSTNTLSTIQGQTGLEFTAKIENIGTGNATNVTLFMQIPENWTITFGDLNLTVGDLVAGDSAENTILVTIPADYATGTYTVTGNATGVNTTGADLGTEGLLYGDTVDVTVGAAPTAITGLNLGKGAAASSASSASSAGSYKSPQEAFTPGDLTQTLNETKFIDTYAEYEITRGEDSSFPLKITNVFSNHTLFEIKIDIQGMLSKYLSWNPAVLNDIKYGESKNFTISLGAPVYFPEGSHDLVFVITGKALATEQVIINGKPEIRTYVKEFKETRKAKLIVHVMTRKDADDLIKKAEKLIAELAEKGITSNRMNQLLADIKAAHLEKNYEKVRDLFEQARVLQIQILDIHGILIDVEKQISNAKKAGLDTEETEKIFTLAKAAFAAERYDDALKRMQEAQEIGLIEIAGAFNLWNFLIRFGWLMAVITGLFVLAGAIIYARFEMSMITQKIERMRKEEAQIHTLIENLQTECFTKNKISVAEYDRGMYFYEKRLESINATMSRLRTRRILLTSPEKELASLGIEQQHALELVKQAQTQYYINQTISRNKYELRVQKLRERMAEIERGIQTIQIAKAEHKYAHKHTAATTLLSKATNKAYNAVADKVVNPIMKEAEKIATMKTPSMIQSRAGKAMLGPNKTETNNEDIYARLEKYGFKVKRNDAEKNKEGKNDTAN